MTRQDIEALRDRTLKATGAHLVALCNVLLTVLDETEKEGPTNDGSSFRLGYLTSKRVIRAKIDEASL